jgi:hypothetical protein
LAAFPTESKSFGSFCAWFSATKASSGGSSPDISCSRPARRWRRGTAGYPNALGLHENTIWPMEQNGGKFRAVRTRDGKERRIGDWSHVLVANSRYGSLRRREKEWPNL